MTAPEQDWLKRLRAARTKPHPIEAGWLVRDSARMAALWPLLCDCIEAAESIEDDRRKSLMTPFAKEDRLSAALAALKDEVERDE